MAAKRNNSDGANTEKNTKERPGLRPPWKPGESGNPSGRPKKKPITEMFERIMNDPELVQQFELAITNSIKKGGMAGVMYFKEAADRVEGKVTQPVELNGKIDLADRMVKARERRSGS